MAKKKTATQDVAEHDADAFRRELCGMVHSLIDSAQVDDQVQDRELPPHAGMEYLLAYSAAMVDALDAAALSKISARIELRRGAKLWLGKDKINDKRDTLRGYLLAGCEALAADAVTHHGARAALDAADARAREDSPVTVQAAEPAPAGEAIPPFPAEYSTFDEAVRNLAAGDVLDISWQPSGARTVVGGPGTKRAKFVRWARGAGLKRFIANVEAVDTRGMPTGRWGSDRTFGVEEIVSIMPREVAEGASEPAITELPEPVRQQVRDWGIRELTVDAIGLSSAEVHHCLVSLDLPHALETPYRPLVEAELGKVYAELQLRQELNQVEAAAGAAPKKKPRGRKPPPAPAPTGDVEPARVEVAEEVMDDVDRGLGRLRSEQEEDKKLSREERKAKLAERVRLAEANHDAGAIAAMSAATGIPEPVLAAAQDPRKKRVKNERIYELAALPLEELRARYQEVYGAPTKASHKRVLAWRISLGEAAIAEGKDPRKPARGARPAANGLCKLTAEQVHAILASAVGITYLPAFLPLREYADTHPVGGAK